jgi:hypothetical protein
MTSASITLRFALSLAFAMPTLLTSGALLAQPGRPGGPGGPGGPSAACKARFEAKYLPTFDANKNGVIDPEEHRAIRDARRREALERFDANHDGWLDRKERAELRYARQVEHFEEIDGNRDASISRDEATASCSPLARGFDEVDTDRDGAVSWDEFVAAAPERRGRDGRRGHRGPHGVAPCHDGPPPPAEAE